MRYYQTKDLFQLQTDLVESKIDMAATKAIDRVLERIDGLQKDMDMRFAAMDDRLSAMDKRLVAVETKLGMVNDAQSEIRLQFNAAQKVITAKFIEYAFRAGWLLLATIGVGISYVVVHSLLT